MKGITKSGGVKWLDYSATVIEYDGEPAILAVANDITDRRKAEKALKQSNDTLNHILAASPIAIGLVENRVLKWVNEEMISMFKFESEEDYKGKNTKQLYAIEDEYHSFGEKIYNKLKTGKPAEGDLTLKRKDGSTFSGHVKMSSRDPSNPMERAIFTISDITWRKQAEEEKEKLITELQTTLAEVKTLRGIIPICSNCKKIRDDEGYWQQVEKYIQDRSEAAFSHGICKECAKMLYPDLEIYDDE
jgi:PAS domain S-box-containing protein